MRARERTAEVAIEFCGPRGQQHLGNDDVMAEPAGESEVDDVKENWARLEAARRRLATHQVEAESRAERTRRESDDVRRENDDLRRRLADLESAPAYDDVAKQLRTALARLEMSTQREKQWQQIYLNVQPSRSG